jgi:hypothetical protein
MLRKELLERAKEMGIKGYSRMTKEQLMQEIVDCDYDPKMALSFVSAPVEEKAPVSENLSSFENKYTVKGSNEILDRCAAKAEIYGISERQYRYLGSLEDNYKISLNWEEINNLDMYQASYKITQILAAIESGKAVKRTLEDAQRRITARKALVEASVKADDNSVTSSQLNYIVELLNKLNICVEMPKDKDDASKLIAKLCHDYAVYQARQIREKETAVVTEAKKLSFVDKVKRLFA